MKAQLLKTDGTVTDVEPKNGKKFSLEELQAFVGGYIEIAYPPHKSKVLVVNEEGRLIGLPVNEAASAIYKREPIVGDALFCEFKQIQ